MTAPVRTNLLGLTAGEICAFLEDQPKFRGRQIFQWIHDRRVESFSEMSNLPKSLRLRLENECALYTGHQDACEKAEDGTQKIRLELVDGALIEAVLLADGADRLTACLSTQVGCAMGCRFCKTATMGFIRNLTAAEIVEQFYMLERSAGGAGSIDSVVFMGMGEPFRNYDEVSRTIRILTDPDGRGMSSRRFTVSTSGLVDGIERLGKDLPQVRLAVSLVSADHAMREKLMPVEKSNPLPRLKEALLNYQSAGGRRITLEYVLLHGINHSTRDIKALKEFTRGLKCNINLIPWNPATGIPPLELPDGTIADLAEPAEKTVREFSRVLEDAGLTVVVRYKKGRGVNAACGQLATKRL